MAFNCSIFATDEEVEDKPVIEIGQLVDNDEFYVAKDLWIVDSVDTTSCQYLYFSTAFYGLKFEYKKTLYLLENDTFTVAMIPQDDKGSNYLPSKYQNGIPIKMYKGVEHENSIIFYSQKVVDGEFIEIKPIFFNALKDMTEIASDNC